MATFVVPIVAPKRVRKSDEIQARQNYYECLADIQRNVIEALTDQQTKDNLTATRRVIKIYQNRLGQTKSMVGDDDSQNVELRCQALEWEQERALALVNDGVVSHDVGYEYIGRLERVERIAQHRTGEFTPKAAIAYVRTLYLRVRQAIIRILPNSVKTDEAEEMRKLQIETHAYVVSRLHALMPTDDVQTEDVSRLLVEYEADLAALRRRPPSVTTSFKIIDQTDDIRRLAYQLELEEIQRMYERERIDRQAAKAMRDNVYLMQMDMDDRV